MKYHTTNIFNTEITIETLDIKQLNSLMNLLHIAELDNIIGSTHAKEQELMLMNAKEKKILETYPIRIWQVSDNMWKAHVPDDTKERNRKTLQGKTKMLLENNILKDYYKKFDDRLIFKNYFAEWLITYKATVVQPATIQRNYADYKKYIAGSKIEKMKITEMKRATIKNFLNATINEYSLTRRSLNNLKSIFNGLFAYAIDCEDITVNPMHDLIIQNTNIQPEKVKEAKTEIFNQQELDVLIKYLYEHYMDNRPIVTLAILLNFQLGLRVGELCTIKKSDIDFEYCTIRIDRTEQSYRPISLVNGEIIEEKTIHCVTDGRTKKDSNRIIDLSNEAISIIHRAIELQSELNIESEYLFADEKGEHIIRQRVNDCLRFHCKQLALGCKSSHKIRKTVLSNLFANNFDLDEVMQIAGHRCKTTTTKYYLFSTNLKSTRKERMNEVLNTHHTFVPTQCQPN